MSEAPALRVGPDTALRIAIHRARTPTPTPATTPTPTGYRGDLDATRVWTGADFRSLRRRARLSQYELAPVLGVARTALCKWEQGRVPVPAWVWTVMVDLAADITAALARATAIADTRRP